MRSTIITILEITETIWIVGCSNSSFPSNNSVLLDSVFLEKRKIFPWLPQFSITEVTNRSKLLIRISKRLELWFGKFSNINFTISQAFKKNSNQTISSQLFFMTVLLNCSNLPMVKKKVRKRINFWKNMGQKLKYMHCSYVMDWWWRYQLNFWSGRFY
jgi:hypothetical protein